MSGGPSVLIAEDDADVLRAARIALTPSADRVETLSSVEGLDELLMSASFDVVLLDMNFVSGDRSAAADRHRGPRPRGTLGREGPRARR